MFFSFHMSATSSVLVGLLVYLGISPEHRGYRCYNPDACRVHISRHVRFDKSSPYYPYTSHNLNFMLTSFEPLSVPPIEFPEVLPSPLFIPWQFWLVSHSYWVLPVGSPIEFLLVESSSITTPFVVTPQSPLVEAHPLCVYQQKRRHVAIHELVPSMSWPPPASRDPSTLRINIHIQRAVIVLCYGCLLRSCV